jgi:hypothetical protein
MKEFKTNIRKRLAEPRNPNSIKAKYGLLAMNIISDGYTPVAIKITKPFSGFKDYFENLRNKYFHKKEMTQDDYLEEMFSDKSMTARTVDPRVYQEMEDFDKRVKWAGLLEKELAIKNFFIFEV